MGYGFPNMANYMLGGVLMSGSHGTLGKNGRSGYTSMVTKVRVLRVDGSIEEALPKPLWTGLGLLGTITESTLQLDVPAYNLRRTVTRDR